MKTQYLTVPDGVLAYDDQGIGPLVLCVPAGGDVRAEYRFLAPSLVAAGYRVLTMDLRGQGESSAIWPDYRPSAVGSDLLALIRQANGGPAVLIATSVATAAAIWASVEASEAVCGLVLISASGRALPPLQAAVIPWLFLGPWWGNRIYAAYFPRMYPSARPADFEAHLRQVNAMLDEPGRLRALRLLFSSSYKDWEARVPQVKTPVLIVNGSRDPDFKDPGHEARSLAERLMAATTTVRLLEGAGHHPQAERPDETARCILDFLAATRPYAAVHAEAM